MRVGDMILSRRTETFSLPADFRYSQGIVVESQPRYGTVMVRWCDGMLHLEEVEKLERYYEVISVSEG